MTAARAQRNTNALLTLNAMCHSCLQVAGVFPCIFFLQRAVLTWEFRLCRLHASSRMSMSCSMLLHSSTARQLPTSSSLFHPWPSLPPTINRTMNDHTISCIDEMVQDVIQYSKYKNVRTVANHQADAEPHFEHQILVVLGFLEWSVRKREEPAQPAPPEREHTRVHPPTHGSLSPDIGGIMTSLPAAYIAHQTPSSNGRASLFVFWLCFSPHARAHSSIKLLYLSLLSLSRSR